MEFVVSLIVAFIFAGIGYRVGFRAGVQHMAPRRQEYDELVSRINDAICLDAEFQAGWNAAMRREKW